MVTALLQAESDWHANSDTNMDYFKEPERQWLEDGEPTSSTMGVTL